MPLEDICVHSAVLKEMREVGPRIDGERDEEEVDVALFDCVMFPPEPGPEQPMLRRVVLVPTLLHYGEDLTGAPLSLSKDQELDLDAPGLPVKWWGRWMVDGEPQPFGPPGEPWYGELVTLKRVNE